MELGLAGKRALVTGSSRGIGAAIAAALADEGVSVAIHGRDPGSVASVAGGIVARGGVAMSTVGNLTRVNDLAEIVRKASAALGGIDILVNNAGVYAGRDWFATTPASWLAFYQSDLIPAVALVQALVPAMRTRAGGGSSMSRPGWRPPRKR